MTQRTLRRGWLWAFLVGVVTGAVLLHPMEAAWDRLYVEWLFFPSRHEDPRALSALMTAYQELRPSVREELRSHAPFELHFTRFAMSGTFTHAVAFGENNGITAYFSEQGITNVEDAGGILFDCLIKVLHRLPAEVEFECARRRSIRPEPTGPGVADDAREVPRRGVR